MKNTTSTTDYIFKIKSGDRLVLSRAISWVENDLEEGKKIISALNNIPEIPVIGITGPPGAGKSSLINCLISQYLSQRKKIAVLAIDPSSPFSGGSILGDRIRMNKHIFQNNIYIRSISTRGILGGISAKTVEIVGLLKIAGFDYILIETAGIGQSEMDITYISDVTVLTLVPESGDEIQIIKSGIMEAADIIVVNKSDREGADAFVHLLQTYLRKSENSMETIPVIKIIANQSFDKSSDSQNGILQLIEEINHFLFNKTENGKKSDCLRKAIFLLKRQLFNKIDIKNFEKKMKDEYENGNLLNLVNNYVNERMR